ncbi:MAG TPA: tyrosine recombinase XerC [Pseudomonadales bacterium]|nr:tyrosine recombinase XerC [Pseudomonadales bacterium]
MQALVDQYLQHLGVERQLSPHTTSAYRRDLALLTEHAQKQNITDAAQLREFHIRQLVASLHGKGLSGRSLQRILSAWRQFFSWLASQRKIDSNPVAAIRAPKSPRKLPRTLDVDQMNQLLSIEGDSWLEKRDHAMLELFYSSGLRLAELAGLDLTALNLDEGLVRVLGKGSKARIVPVGRVAIIALRTWLAVRNENLPATSAKPETAVFIGQQGKRLGARAIQLRLRHYSLKQGMAEPVHPHMLRHAFASHVLESSSDLRAVQELLGHANISTTQIYTHLDFQHLARVYDAAHPRAQKKPQTNNEVADE